jgi:hypothetical protein
VKLTAAAWLRTPSAHPLAWRRRAALRPDGDAATRSGLRQVAADVGWIDVRLHEQLGRTARMRKTA